MDKQQVIERLHDLSVKLRTPRLRQKDIRTVKGLEYAIRSNFSGFAEALKASGLEPTSLAEKMATPDNELLLYLFNLGRKLERRPTVLDIRKDGRFSEVIFGKRFGNVKKAYELALRNMGTKTEERRIEEQILEFPNKGLFIGRAAETYIVAELMYRGFNASILPVDLGVDVVAVKDNKTFYFQVKNISFDKNQSRKIPITTSSFLKNQSTNVFYAFVLLKGQNKEVLMLPFLKIRELMNEGILQIDKESKDFLIEISRLNNLIKVNSKDKTKSSDVSSYLNDWGIIV